MDFFEEFLVSLAAIVLVALLGFYAVLGLAKRNFLWTKVEQGWYKVVMRLGCYHITLGPGLHWLGWPGVYTLYSRKMVFKKCVVKDDGDVTVEDHDDSNITSFKSTRYPYAIPFKDEEDSHGLPLTGVIATHARMADPSKAFFVASDWYVTTITLVISALRQVFTEVSWEQITGQNVPAGSAVKVFGQRLWEAMNAPRESGKPSVIVELRDTYGIEVESVELASIDPPPGWRDTTLAPYKAQKEKEAAVHEAAASATRLDDTNQALEAWKKAHPGASPEQITKKQDELAKRAYLKAGGQNLEVHGLENATTAVVGGGGGGAGILVGGQGKRGGGNRDGQQGGQGPRQRGRSNMPVDPAPYEQAAADHFARNGKYPKWDPLKRTPN